MHFLVRKDIAGGGMLDTEYDTAVLAIGGDAGCDVPLPGLVGRVELRGSQRGGQRGGVAFRARRQVLAHNGKAANKGVARPGDELVLGEHRLTVIEPPAGFDVALQLHAGSVAWGSGAPMDLAQAGWRMRRWAWALAGVVALAVLLPVWGFFSPPVGALLRATPLPDDALWSTGPLDAAHRIAAIGADCQACHTRAFGMVEDAACDQCHQVTGEHAAEGAFHAAALEQGRCASCHREHNEPPNLVRRDAGVCVACHRVELPAGPGHAGAQPAWAFTAAGHPEFRMALLRPPAAPAAPWTVERARPHRELVETSGLKFPHDVHLDAAKVSDAATGSALQCESCHLLAADGRRFRPVTMDGQCRSCHTLAFDRFYPELELPHGDPAAVLIALELHYVREFSDPALRARRAVEMPRRVPGRRESAATCAGDGLACGRAEAAREAEFQFATAGCVTCHDVIENGAAEPSARWHLAPVRLAGDWFPRGNFDHRSHLNLKALNDARVCESCHDVASSDSAGDIAMPGRDRCLDCHADDAAQTAALACVSCHDYHQPSLPANAAATMAGGRDLLTEWIPREVPR